jgi:hypothetical protein
MLSISRLAGEVTADESPTRHFDGCPSSSLDLEMRLEASSRPWLISVNSRLSVSERWLFRCFAQLVSPSTDGKHFDFRNVVLVLEMHFAKL